MNILLSEKYYSFYACLDDMSISLVIHMRTCFLEHVCNEIQEGLPHCVCNSVYSDDVTGNGSCLYSTLPRKICEYFTSK